MTVTLANLAMDFWHGLCLSRRMNTSCTVCCVFLSSPCTNKEILKKECGILARDRCNYPWFAESCWVMPNFTENGSDHQSCCTVHFASVPSATVLGSMHAPCGSCHSYFPGMRVWPESSMYFPRNTGVLQDYVFPLREIEIKWFSWALGKTGCLYQMDIKPRMAYSLQSLHTTNYSVVCSVFLAYMGKVVKNEMSIF